VNQEEKDQEAPDADVDTERCEECGFVYRLDQAAAVIQAAPALAEEVARLLRSQGVDLRSRREPQVWSPLEYGCHLRDVFLVQRERVMLACRVDRPEFTSMGRDERVDQDGYRSQNPEDVARQLSDAALMFSGMLKQLSAAEWERMGLYPFPEPTPRTIAWVAVHTLHEARHHLMDIRRQLG
jgi:hypothetical protein